MKRILILLIALLPLLLIAQDTEVFGDTDLTTRGDVGGADATFTGDVSVGDDLIVSGNMSGIDSIGADQATITSVDIQSGTIDSLLDSLYCIYATIPTIVLTNLFADTLQGNTWIDVCNTAQLNADIAYIDTVKKKMYVDSVETPVLIATRCYLNQLVGDILVDSISGNPRVDSLDGPLLLDTLSVPIVTGDVQFEGEINQVYAPTAGTNMGNILKTTLGAGLTYDGTTAGMAVKIYDEDATVNHDGGELACYYGNLKLLSTIASGGKSVIYSGHNYNSSIEIDAGIWLYGKFGYGLKVSGDTVGIGVDFSETAITTADLKLENGATIANASTGKTTVSDTLAATHFDGHLAGLADTASVLVGDWFGTGTWAGNTAEVAIYTAGSTTGAIPVVFFDALVTTAGIDVTVVTDSLYIAFDPADTAAATGKKYFYQVRD